MKHKPSSKAVIGIILSCALLFSVLPFFQTHAGASGDPYDISGKIDSVLDKALGWVDSGQKPGGSWGDDRLVNDTAYSVYSLRHNDRDYSAGSSFLTNFDVDENTDTLSHILMATGLEAQYTQKLLSHQNSDGGFGLSVKFSSDAYDSVLALEALEDVNGGQYNDVIKKIVFYLLASQNKDGSWSGNEYNDGNAAFTARAAYAVKKYLTDNRLTSNTVVSAYAKTSAYLSSVKATDVSEAGLQATLYTQMIGHLSDDYSNVYNTVEALEKVQKGNGSFYDDIYDTYLVIKYLNSLNTINDSYKVESFDVALDNNTFTVNEDGQVNGQYTIDYKTVVSRNLTVATKLYDDEKELASSETPVTLDSDNSTVSGSAFSFDINEKDIKTLKIVSSLCDGTKELYSSTGYLYVQEKPVVPDTQVTDAGITLSDNYGFVNEEKEVTSGIYILYSSNVERRLTAVTTVTCDGKVVATDESEVALTPDSTSVTLETTTLVINESAAKTYTYTTEFRSGETLWYTAQREYTVYEKPENAQQNKITHFSVLLDDYSSYTSTSLQTVTASCEMLYSVYQDINVTLRATVTDGNEVLGTSEKQVTLTPDSTKGVYDVIAQELDLSTAKSYDFKIELIDSGGNSLGETAERFKVAARPDMEFMLSVDTSVGDEYSAKFSWNDISSEYEQYGYHLLRSADGGKTWETRSSWDGEKVKVLNIYPNSSSKNYLIDWMNKTDPETGEPAGKGLFDIDTVIIEDYNRAPDKYLKDNKGNYQYDVLMFGTYDSNAFKDISESARDATQGFIDSGRGVLFGHDTVCRKQLERHENFATFDTQIGIIAADDGYSPYAKTKVRVVNEGFLTSFPWKISGELTVPPTHVWGQFAGGSLQGTVWMSLDNSVAFLQDPETGATNDFYLVTNNNLAMIQTGHSNGQATIDECKVFANTLFYLKQTSSGSSVDNSFYDETAPDKPEAELSLTDYQKNNYSLNVGITAEDKGSDYQYRVEALPKSGVSDKVLSNTVGTSAISGVHGFVVIQNDTAESAVSQIKYDADGKTPLDIIEATDGSANYEMKELEKNKKYYLHIFAVDNANNISEEYVKEIYDNEEVLLQAGINSYLVSDKLQYTPGETAELTATSYTTGSTLNATAEIELQKLDGTSVLTVAQNINRQLTSKARWSESFEFPTENLPTGKYMAVLRWRLDGEVAAQSKCLVKIAENEGDPALELSSKVTTGADYSNTLNWTDLNSGAENVYIPTDFSVVVDCSGSMRGDRVTYAKAAVNKFIDELNEGDRMNLIAFTNSAELFTDFTDDKTKLHTAASWLFADGWTSVSSGMNLSVGEFKKDNNTAEHHKAIVLICDGDVDNCSSAINYAIDNNITIYPVNVVNADSAPLQNMASQTGGRYYYTNVVYDMEEILQSIKAENDKGNYYYQINRDDEEKGVTFDPEYLDIEFDDKEAPVILSTQLFASEINDETYTGTIKVKAADVGTDYEYFVNAVDRLDKNHIIRSNAVTAVALSDIKGFVYAINTDSSPCPEIAYNESLFVESDEDLTIDITNFKRGEIYYLHIFALDNNDNYSEETIYRFVVGKPMFDSTNVTTSIKTDKESYHIGDTVYPDVTAKTDFYKVFAKGVVEITDSSGETVEVIEPDYVVEIPSYDELNRQFEWKAEDVVAGEYYAIVKWYDGENMLASDSAKFTILPDGEINDRVRTDKYAYSVGESIELTDYIFNNTTNHYANDLDVKIDILNEKENVVKTVSGTVGAMAGATGLFTDTVSADSLGEGSYQAVSSVKLDDEVVASSATDFTVSDDEIAFSGTIEVKNYNDRNKQFAYTVTNKSDSEVKDAAVRVSVYSSNGTLVGTIDKKADFSAGESKSFEEIFNIEKLSVDDYIVALSVHYDDKSGNLGESGFTISSVCTYTVTFLNYNGKVISTQTVEYGKAATAPEAPQKPSDDKYNYVFSGWDKAFDNVTSDLTVTAVFESAEKTQDATSSVQPVATPSEVTTQPSVNTPTGAVQTGQFPFAVVSVIALIAVYGVLVFYGKRNKGKEDK